MSRSVAAKVTTCSRGALANLRAKRHRRAILLEAMLGGAGPVAVAIADVAQDGPRSASEIAAELANPNTTLGSLNFNLDHVSYQSTLLQPIIVYTMPDAVTFSLNTESTCDWNAEHWTVPINASVSKLTSLRGPKVQFQFGVRTYA